MAWLFNECKGCGCRIYEKNVYTCNECKEIENERWEEENFKRKEREKQIDEETKRKLKNWRRKKR